jgi:hypothetical protein
LIYCFIGYITLQLLTKKFKLHERYLVIKFPLGFVNRNRWHKISCIKEIHFKSNNAPADPDRVLIDHYNRNWKKRYYFSCDRNDVQKLIDILRDKGVDVKVTSHVWH